MVHTFTLDDLAKTQKAVKTYQNSGMSPSCFKKQEERKIKQWYRRRKKLVAACGNTVTHEEILQAVTVTGCTYASILARLLKKPVWSKQDALNVLCDASRSTKPRLDGDSE